MERHMNLWYFDSVLLKLQNIKIILIFDELVIHLCKSMTDNKNSVVLIAPTFVHHHHE